jgi:hypothetical protein
MNILHKSKKIRPGSARVGDCDMRYTQKLQR